VATQSYVDGVTLSSAAEWNKWDTVAYSVLSGVAGTNTITATGPANYSYAAATPPVWFIPAVTNTGATTINITPSGGAALGAKNVFLNGAALVGNELIASRPCALIYDGTQFHIVANSNLARLPTLGTEQASTSGTSIDFTGIPSWAKWILIKLVGVSTNGTSELVVQIGDAGGVEASGYAGAQITLPSGGAISGNQHGNFFYVADVNNAAADIHGHVLLTLEDAANFTWAQSGSVSQSNAISGHISSGSKSLSAELDRVRITTAGGTDTFDAGAINILYG
jgi:hypothetical protein